MEIIKYFYVVSCVVFGLTFSNLVSANPAEELTIEDFVKLPSQRNVQISPDGKHLSVIFRSEGKELLAILERETSQPLKIIGVEEERSNIGEVHWVNNTRLIYTMTKSFDYDNQLYDNGELVGVDIDGSNHKLIFGYRAGQYGVGRRATKKNAEYGHHEIIDLLKDEAEQILIAFYPWRTSKEGMAYDPEAIPLVYKLNVNSGRKSRVDVLPIPGSTAVTDDKGIPRFAVGIDQESNLIVSYKDQKSEKWQPFTLTDFEGTNIRPIGFNAENSKVYLIANVGMGTRALYTLNLENGTTKKVFHDPLVDISLTIKDFTNKRIIAVGTELGLPSYHYLDPTDLKAKLHRQLLGAFPGSDILITSATDSGDRFIVKVYSDINSGDYFLFESKTMQAKYLLSQRPWIRPESMSPTKSMDIKTRDDESIQAYITLPRLKKSTYPMIVLPHGGPHGVRDDWGFDWEVQMLANYGYAVLQVNFRGSDGFGRQFEEAGYGKWGTLMQDDITDATQAMIAQGVADPKRICIFGASYGGYAALMGAVREPDLYRCAIGSMGVYDLPMMFEKGDIPRYDSGLAYLSEVLGSSEDDQKARSPAYNVEKITANILLIHGAQDHRAPIAQAESLKNAFDKIGKNYEWMRLGDEGHGYNNESNRLKVYSKVLTFLDENIGEK